VRATLVKLPRPTRRSPSRASAAMIS